MQTGANMSAEFDELSEGRNHVGGAAGMQPPPNPSKPKFKKHRFCRQDGIKRFT
jgi:hypothetical protein